MQNNPIVIAVDGPAASGKGTLAKRLAAYFDLDYLDTGKIYRAVAYHILLDGKDPNDDAVAIAYARKLSFKDLKVDKQHLYDEGVGGYASIISANQHVREALLQFQKDAAKSKKGAVLDGRDIGTVICPDADFKFFITADLKARAKRRFNELHDKGKSVVYESILDDLKCRDERDSKRDIAPLKQADDALHIDTTAMDADAVFAKAYTAIVTARPDLVK